MTAIATRRPLLHGAPRTRELRNGRPADGEIETLVDRTAASPVLDLVVPVYCEERALPECVRRLVSHLRRNCPYRWRITIADNASTDATWEIAERTARTTPGVRAIRLRNKGRGRALRAAWSLSDAKVVAYTDVDLSTDLAALLPLIAPLVSRHSDVAIGTRLARGSQVARGPRRELISRAYNFILKLAARARFSDAQCGFKAVRAEVARALLPEVEDEEWFFDTELLLLAQRSGLRIHEVPVDWSDDPDSRVDVMATALADLRGLARVTRRGLAGRFRVEFGDRAVDVDDTRLVHQLAWFALVGATTTVIHLGGFLALQGTLGFQLANAVSLSFATIVNTQGNRRFTFTTRGRHRLMRDHAEAATVFGASLGATAGSLALLQVAWPMAPEWVAVGALIAANGLATLARFIALRSWVFHPGRRGRAAASEATS